MPTALKSLLLTPATFAAATLPDPGQALSFLMIVALLFGAPRYFRAARAEAREKEKDRTIATHEQSIKAKDERLAELGLALDQCRAESRNFQADAEKWKGKYETQSQYTAPEALSELKILIADLVNARTKSDQVIVQAVNAQGELIMKNTEVLAGIAARLEVGL